jgi:hypothetical protein
MQRHYEIEALLFTNHKKWGKIMLSGLSSWFNISARWVNNNKGETKNG